MLVPEVERLLEDGGFVRRYERMEGMPEPTYGQRVDAFARQWMTEHPERLTGWTQGRATVDNSQPITLFWTFDQPRVYSEVTYDPATFNIGFLVPIFDVGLGTRIPVSMQFDAEEIDIGVILRGVLAVDVEKWGNVSL